MTSRVVEDYKALTSRLRALNPQDPKTIFESLDRLIAGNRPEEAVESSIKLVIRRPGKQVYWQKLSQIIFAAQGPTRQPTQFIDKAKEIVDQGCAANNPFAFLVRAQLKERSEGLESAFADLSKAIEAAPELKEPYLMRAVNSMHRQDNSSAITDLTKFIDLKPEAALLAAAYSHRAECYMNLGTPQPAIHDFSMALAIQPRNYTLLRERARAWFVADQYAEAMRDLSQASEVSHEREELLEILKAHLSFASGQTEQGLAILRKLEPVADSVGARLNIAEAYLVANPEEALRILEGIRKPKSDAAPLVALRSIAAILLGRKTAEQSIQEATHLKEDMRRTGWSWFEIRQFLRWGLSRGTINNEKKEEIERLIAELGSEVPAGSLAWSALAQVRMWTLDRLQLSSSELVPSAVGQWISEE